MSRYSRSAWGARSPKSRTPLSSNQTDAIVIHYSAAFSDELPIYKNRVKGIQNYHMDSNGWSDIAYNWLVARNGDVFEGRGWGVMSAATLHHNDHTQAICFLGADRPNRDDVTDKGRRAISELIFDYEHFSGRRVDRVHAQHAPRTKLSVGGHRDFVSTECPGDELYHFVTLKGWQVYRKKPKVGYPPGFFKFAAWYLGEGAFKKYGPRNRKVYPKGLPSLYEVHKMAIYWLSLKRFVKARKK